MTRPPVKPAMYRPSDPHFSRGTHDVLVKDQPRTDYRIARDAIGQIVVFDELSDEEACHIQIIERGQRDV